MSVVSIAWSTGDAAICVNVKVKDKVKVKVKVMSKSTVA